MASSSLRKIFIMRHAERVDFAFGSWISVSFDHQQNYVRKDLNMPVSVPKRSGGPLDFNKDCPLTNIGLYQATLVGEAMKEHNVKFSHVFCSPSLRCIETCTNVLKASGQDHLQINIEPGLFEWLSWHRNGLPKWMSLEEFKSSDFNIAMEYEPVISRETMNITQESCEEYYMRSYLVVTKILEKCSDGNILLVGHAATLDTCSRQLTGRAPRNKHDIQHLVHKFSYASVVVVDETEHNTWQLTDPPFPSLKHSNNLSFEWKILLAS